MVTVARSVALELVTATGTSGPAIHLMPGYSAVVIESTTHAPTTPWSRIDLSPLLEARSVAIIGASQRPGSVGNQVIRQLLGGGFQGRIVPVNPAL